jgi:SAM-dependent methyltransferase
VWGIDASMAMIERLRAKPGGDAIPVAVGDMADVDLSALPGAPTRFAVVFVAFNTFFNLPDETAQRRCLRRAREVLAPGGRLVIEAHVPDDGAARDGIELRRMSPDRIVLIVTRQADDPSVLVGEHLEIDARGVRRRPWVIRMCGPTAIDAMAADAGLRLAERWSSWHGDAYRDGDPVHVSLYAAR